MEFEIKLYFLKSYFYINKQTKLSFIKRVYRRKLLYGQFWVSKSATAKAASPTSAASGANAGKAEITETAAAPTEATRDKEAARASIGATQVPTRAQS